MGAPNAMNFGQPIVVGTLASDPVTAVNGQIYYNSSSGQFKMYQAGAWQVTATGSSGANTTLSNLTNPTSVNQSLIPASAGSQVLGSLTDYWGPSVIQTLVDTSNVTSVDAFNRILHDSGTHSSIDWANRLLIDSAGTTQLAWSTSGVALSQLTATTVPYLNSSKILTSSSVTPTQLGYLSGATGTTGTGNIAFSASPTFTGTVNTANMSVSGSINMNTNLINNLSPGVSGTDAINLNQLQNAISGITQWRPEATLLDIVDTTLPSTTATQIDSTTVTNGMRVLFTNLSAITGFTGTFGNASNSITVSSTTGLYIGMTISDTSNPSYIPANTIITNIVGLVVSISQNTTNSGTADNLSATGNNYVWNAAVSGSSITWSTAYDDYRTTPAPQTNDSILILKGTSYAQASFNFNGSSWVQFNGAGQIQAGSALSKTGNTLNVKYDNSTIGLNGSNQLYIPNDALTTTQLASNANIAFSQLTALTSANILVGNGSNVATSVAVTGDVTLTNAGVTAVAKIAGTTVSGTTGSGNVVFSASPTLTGTITAAAANFSGAIGANSGITSSGALSINANSGASAINLLSSTLLRGVTTSAAVTETYVDATTLTDNSGPTAVAAFQFSTSSYLSEEITYQIKTGTATADVRIGVLRIACNASGTQITSITDMNTETADCGVTWTASVSSGTVSVSYTCSNQGSNRVMRADVKQFRA